MYVCICNAVTDQQIREAAASGVEDLWSLQASLGVASTCGCCKDVAAEILRQHRVSARTEAQIGTTIRA